MASTATAADSDENREDSNDTATKIVKSPSTNYPKAKEGHPTAILGCMEHGRRLDFSEALKVTRTFLGSFKMLDTAIMYTKGDSEKFLGRMKSKLLDSQGALIATKANPKSHKEGLAYESVIWQCNQSLKSLQTDSVDLFYLHWPDPSRPIGDALRAVNDLYKQGKFRRFGLSNYSAWQVTEIWYLCKENGYVLPTVYQGVYNAFTRGVEKELIPCLRRFGIDFYGYNPLAGGILTGKHKRTDIDDGSVQKGRFHLSQGWAEAYRKRYFKTCMFDALEIVQKALDEAYPDKSVSLANAALRWMTHHSVLGQNDGVIIGVSSTNHLAENIQSMKEKEPLKEGVVKAFDEGWDLCAASAFNYFR